MLEALFHFWATLSTNNTQPFDRVLLLLLFAHKANKLANCNPN